MTLTPLALSGGVISADPTLYIAISWGLSALLIGGLVAHALWASRRKP